MDQQRQGGNPRAQQLFAGMRCLPEAWAPHCWIALAPRGLLCQSRLLAPLWVSYLKRETKDKRMPHIRDALRDCGLPSAPPPRCTKDRAGEGGEAKGHCGTFGIAQGQRRGEECAAAPSFSSPHLAYPMGQQTCGWKELVPARIYLPAPG